MVRVVHHEQSEITMDYVNCPDASARGRISNSRSGNYDEVTAAASGRKLYTLVAVSFGLLCILQAALNISLRLTLVLQHDALTEERNELKRQLKNIADYYQPGWVYFNHSYYFISTREESWQDSRNDCLLKGADLLIINSIEEQYFVNHLRKSMWIGLADSEKNRKWKWVDGTPLTTSYWGHNEPNGLGPGLENCVHVKNYDLKNSWNDEGCQASHFWTCEKKIPL